MCNIIKQYGTIIYDPYRGDMKTKNNWCILQLPKDFARYYQYFLRKETHIVLNDPTFNAHVSIVRGESPPNMQAWKKYNNMPFYIEYEPEIVSFKDTKKAGSYYCINFESKKLSDIREELGLTPHKIFHITIGRTNYD